MKPSLSPRKVQFTPDSKKDKLQRYLDVPRAELFFARRVILVEGAAELFIVDALAQKAGYDLKKSSVSLLSTEGLNFDCFLPMFGDDSLNICVAVITDADPPAETYPALTDPLVLSANAKSLEASKSGWVQPFFAKKTLEANLSSLSEPFAEKLGIASQERRFFVRFDVSKANYVQPVETVVLRKIPETGALVRWPGEQPAAGGGRRKRATQ